MTTTIPFNPSPTENFQFTATLDGNDYNVIVNWNLFGARYYLAIYTFQGALVVLLPLIGSPLNYDISLTKGYFTSTMVYRVSNSQFEISP